MRGKNGDSPRVSLAIEQSTFIVHRTAESAALPASGSGRERFHSEDPTKFQARPREFLPDFLQRHAVEMILPADMIVAVNSHFEASRADHPHHPFVAPADMRRGEQRAIEQRAHAVELDNICPADFREKSRTKHPADRLPGVIRPEAEKSAGRRAEFGAISHEIPHAEPGSPIGVDVDL